LSSEITAKLAVLSVEPPPPAAEDKVEVEVEGLGLRRLSRTEIGSLLGQKPSFLGSEEEEEVNPNSLLFWKLYCILRIYKIKKLQNTQKD
jgi:hypothetical protein